MDGHLSRMPLIFNTPKTNSTLKNKLHYVIENIYWLHLYLTHLYHTIISIRTREPLLNEARYISDNSHDEGFAHWMPSPYTTIVLTAMLLAAWAQKRRAGGRKPKSQSWSSSFVGKFTAYQTKQPPPEYRRDVQYNRPSGRSFDGPSNSPSQRRFQINNWWQKEEIEAGHRDVKPFSLRMASCIIGYPHTRYLGFSG